MNGEREKEHVSSLVRHALWVALVAALALAVAGRICTRHCEQTISSVGSHLERRERALHHVLSGFASSAAAAATDHGLLSERVRRTEAALDEYQAVVGGDDAEWRALHGELRRLAQQLAQKATPPELASALDKLEQQTQQMRALEKAQLAHAMRDLELREGSDILLLVAMLAYLAALAELARRRERRDRDVTRLQLQALELTAHELRDFAGRVAHDLRGPLQPIVLSSQMIERSPVPEAVRRLAERIEVAAGRLRAMVDMMLTFARLQGALPATTTTDVRRIALDVADDCRERALALGVTLALELDEEVRVTCEPEIVASAVQNLVDNALKYGLDGADKRIEVRCRRRQRCGVLEVEDHGSGIPPEVLPHVFEPLFRGTARGEGIGLGLATVKRLVEARAGTITVGRGGGGGARFVVELPLAPLPLVMSQPSSPTQIAAKSS